MAHGTSNISNRNLEVAMNHPAQSSELDAILTRYNARRHNKTLDRGTAKQQAKEELQAYVNQKIVEELKTILMAKPVSDNPRFVTEPLAVAHAVVERIKELDPEFSKELKRGS